MKKLIILLISIGIVNGNLQSVAIDLNAINTAITNITSSISNNQRPNDNDINNLKNNLKIASNIKEIGSLKELVKKLNRMIDEQLQPFLLNCSYYQNLIYLFQKLLNNDDSSLQALLKGWDKQPNLFNQPGQGEAFSPQALYIQFYNNATNLYLKLFIAQKYINNEKIDQLALASIDKIIDDVIPDLNTPSFKQSISSDVLETQRDILINAFTKLTSDGNNFIQQYCQLQAEYTKNDWKNDKQYWKNITENYDDDDTFDDNLFNNEEKILVLKSYLEKRIKPLYDLDIKTIQENLNLWLGESNDVLSMLEKEIKNLAPQKSQEEIEIEKIKEFYKKIHLLLQRYTLNLIDDKTFKLETETLKQNISDTFRLDQDAKLKLHKKLDALEKQKTQIAPLLSFYKPPKDQPDEKILNEAEIFFNTQLNDLQRKVTLFAGANSLRNKQYDDLKTAIDIYTNFTLKKESIAPSPLDNTHRDVVNAYIKAATLLEQKPAPNTKKRIKLNNKMNIINNASDSIWKNIKSWLPQGINDIKEEYEKFLNSQQKQKSISQQELLKALINLNVELIALNNQIK